MRIVPYWETVIVTSAKDNVSKKKPSRFRDYNMPQMISGNPQLVRLADAALSELAVEFQKLNQDDFHQIHYQNMGNGYATTVPLERLRMQLLRSDEFAARQYGALRYIQNSRVPPCGYEQAASGGLTGSQGRCFAQGIPTGIDEHRR